MKELSIEQKAKRYDEALESAREYKKHGYMMINVALDNIFPELKENGDERIRKMLIEFFGMGAKCNSLTNGIADKDIIAWLEKQGESSNQIHYWTEEEIEPIISDYLRGVEHYGGMIAKLRCLKPKSLEKQGDTNETINRDKFAQGVLRGAALNLITWIDYNTAEGNMCLSNMECKDIEDALVSGDWDKIYTYIKKKLEKQGETFTKKDVDDAYLKGVTNTKNEIEKQYEANYQIRKDIATFIFNYRGNIKDRAKWMDYLGVKVSFAEKQDEKPRYSIGDVLCDKSCTTLDKNAQPNFEVTDIRDGMYICDKCSFPISQQDEYELVAKKKSTNKPEPKFHEGDWVVYECGEETATLQITRIVGETYVFSDDSTLGVVDEDTLRLWNITKDAKDGDMLYTKGGIGHEKKDIVFIFKGIGSRDYLDEPCIEHYCYLCEDGFYVNTTGFMGVLSDNIKQGTCPATKEQRDLLFQKMHEAGYEWYADKKKLKKIDQNPAKGTKGNEREIPFSEKEPVVIIPKFRVGDEIKTSNEESITITKIDKKGYWSEDLFICGFGEECLWDLVEQNPAWSEEDEKNSLDIKCLIGSYRAGDAEYRLDSWIDSLKNRVQPQSQQEWSEEDEAKRNALIGLVEEIKNQPLKRLENWDEYISWLKSLRPQKQWRPSDEQIASITCAVRKMKESACYDSELESLFNDLKKLKG